MPPRLGAFIAIVLWGVSFVATKAAVGEIPPVTLVVARFTLGVGFVSLLVIAKRQRLVPPRDTWPAVIGMGFIGVFVHQMLQSYALTMTTAVQTGWLIGLCPIWTAVLSALFLGERFGVMKTAGLALGAAGAALVVTRGELSFSGFALPATRGDLLILASTVNWGVYTILGHGTIKRLGSTLATAATMTAGLAMLAPFFIASAGWRDFVKLTATGWLAVIFLGIGCSGLAYLFWYAALQRVETSKVAAFLYLEPLVTFAAAVVLLGEPVHLTTVIGGLVVLGGVLLVQTARPPQPKPAAGRADLRDAG